MESYVLTKTCTQMSTVALFLIAKTKANKMMSSRWVNTQTVVPPDNGMGMECQLALKKSELSSQEKTRRKCKWVSLSKRSKSEKTSCWMVPSARHLGKAKTWEHKQVHCGQGGGDEGSTGIFLSYIFYNIPIYLFLYLHMLKHIIESNTQSWWLWLK